MKKQEFREALLEQTRKAFGEEYQIHIHQIRKNNGIQYDGLLINKKGEPGGPVLNLDNLWDFHVDPDSPLTVDEIVEEILKSYNEVEDGIPKEFRDLEDFSKFCGKIFYKLVNYEKNKEFLETAPHIKFEDMAILYYVSFCCENGGRTNLTVSHGILERWKVTEDDLYCLAVINTSREFPAKLQSMKEVLGRLGGKLGEMERIAGPSLYILSNQEGKFGAATILYPGELQKAAEKIGSDLIILPSSLHEVLLLPLEEGMDLEELKSLVQRVNGEVVSPEDVLSDEVYCYLRREGRIRKAGDGKIGNM